MKYADLSVNPSGKWSLRQARRVQEIINPEAAEQGVVFVPLDVTTHSDKCSMYMLIAYCIKHDIAIRPDDVCSACLRHIKADVRVIDELSPDVARVVELLRAVEV